MHNGKEKQQEKAIRQATCIAARIPARQSRSLPLGKCYVNDYKNAAGLAVVVVTRLHPNGNVTWALYEVDMYCLGVKDAFVRVNEPPTRFQKRLDELNGSFGLVETGYDVCHNMVYGAVEFAREAGINPVAEFSSARYLLEEDTDDIPLIEYEYGATTGIILSLIPRGVRNPILPCLKRTSEKETIPSSTTARLPSMFCHENYIPATMT